MSLKFVVFISISLSIWGCNHYQSDDIIDIYIPLEERGAKDELNSQIDAIFNSNFDLNQLSNSKGDNVIRYGYDLITKTNEFIGPDVDELAMRFTGNHLSCTNCHLKAGTTPFSAPYIGVTKRFPQYKGRANDTISMESRINGCMERSMNGKALDKSSNEIKAMIAYMEWLSKDTEEGNKIMGKGFVKVKIPNRKVDLQQGENIFNSKCMSCHGAEGKGVLNSSGGYTFPPLWGDDSFNNGAGMHRVLTAMQFIKGNMPLGATYQNPLLTDAEAYDVAGYINSFDRPTKSNLSKDFPDRTKKPMSSPYPPYADDFSLEQHKFGPFIEIIDFYKSEYNITKTK